MVYPRIPVYWEQVEPKEGKFDFTAVDELLAGARRYEMNSSCFGSPPGKTATWTMLPNGSKPIPNVSNGSKPKAARMFGTFPRTAKPTRKLIKRLFVALCKHLKAKDGTDRTVIAVQIENEQGIIGSDRDYGPEAQAEFDSPVPAKLVAAMKKAGCGRIYDIWQQSGAKSPAPGRKFSVGRPAN